MKKASTKVKNEWHAPNTQMGSGDYYGTGIKNPMGKSIVNMGVKEVSAKRLTKPPKSLA